MYLSSFLILDFSRVGGDDLHSTCSTCSSSGLGFDLVRKCTVSADSLLLLQHPRSDALSTSGRSASGTPDIRGLLKATSTSVVGGSTASSPGPYKVSTGFAVQRPVPKQQLEVGQKLPASLSSDQIHARKGELELVTGARSASPKLPARQEEGAIGGVEEPKPGEKKRKISIASEVFSRMGGQTRLARFLRRTHSAGCSKDIPSYALFLREKPMVSSSLILTESPNRFKLVHFPLESLDIRRDKSPLILLPISYFFPALIYYSLMNVPSRLSDIFFNFFNPYRG